MNYKPLKINFIPMFYRLNKYGKCVIKCRLRFNDEKIEFSTGIFIIPESWNRKNQNVHPPNQENDYINSELSLIKNKLNQAFLLLKVQEKSFTLEDVILIFKGGAKNPTLSYRVFLFPSQGEKFIPRGTIREAQEGFPSAVATLV
jgi:hypothetical protein